jgi:hypothetical protein
MRRDETPIHPPEVPGGQIDVRKRVAICLAAVFDTTRGARPARSVITYRVLPGVYPI